MQPGPPPPNASTPQHDEDNGHVDVIAQLSRGMLILRRRWLIIAVTTALCIAGSALALKLLKPRWRASASVVIHMSGPQVLDKVEGVGENAQARVVGYKEYYQTQRHIMRSRIVAEAALAKLGLASDPEFLGIANISDPEDREAKAAEIDPIERLREIVTVTEVRNSRVVEISAEYASPELARDIANEVTNAYIEYMRTSRDDLGKKAKLDIADERLQAKSRLRTTELELERFKKNKAITSISLSDRQNEITDNILTLNKQAKEAQRNRDRLQRVLGEAKVLHAKDELASAYLQPEDKLAIFQELRKEQTLARLKFGDVNEDFGPKHEQHRKTKKRRDLLDKSVQRETKALLSALQGQVTAAAQHERFLSGKLDQERQRALDLSSLERSYRELEREVNVASDEYMMVARRDTEIGLTNRVEAAGIEVLDLAHRPTEPIFPPKGMLLALGLVAGLSLGSVLALSIDLRDSRLRGLLDLERALSPFGVPVLGQLPLIAPNSRLGAGNTRAQRRQRDLYAHLYPQSLMAERCRGIRTSIAFVQGPEAAKTIMITSPSSSEGKSSTAVNLAISFCQSGKKVLIIDADMRRPRLHQVFDVDPSVPGLSAILTETCTLGDAVQSELENTPESLYVLPCGDLPENPAELLDSSVLRRLLVEASERFDVVVFDSPPILPVADPLILARAVDGVVLVGRCDQTSRGELQRALSNLAQSDANMLGVVLNEVDARQERYDYGGGSGYYTYRARDTGTDAS